MYKKHNWKTGEKITAGLLNNVEDGLETVDKTNKENNDIIISKFDEIEKSMTNFEGFEVTVTKASTVETSTQLWYRAELQGLAVKGSNISTEFMVYSDDLNVSYAKTAFFASSSKTSITAGTSMTRHDKVNIDKGFTAYKDSFVSTMDDNTYLHVLLRISQVDANAKTIYNATNPLIKMNDTILPLEFAGIHTLGSPTATYKKINSVDQSIITGEALAATLEGLTKKKENESGYIYFTVSVNQNFDDNEKTTTNIQDSENNKPVYCVLKLPDNYSATGKAVPLVMWAHGAGGKVTASDPGELAQAVPYFTSKGYALFDVNGSHNDYTDHADHMGSPRAISAYLKAYEYIVKNYNVEPRLFVHGHSMGGLLALNFASQNKDIVKVLGVVHPVTDMQSQAWAEPWFAETKKQIAIEFNFKDQTGANYEADKVIGYNPIANDAVIVAEQEYILTAAPIKIWHGDADDVVDISGSQKYVDAIKRTGGRAYLRTIQGIGHTVTATMFEENRLWFDRFKN